MDYQLSRGSHPHPDAGRCAMEWVAHLAGETHTDSPSCVDPLIRSYCMALNDLLADKPRQALRPYLARTIGTANDGHTIIRQNILREWLDDHTRNHQPLTDLIKTNPEIGWSAVVVLSVPHAGVTTTTPLFLRGQSYAGPCQPALKLLDQLLPTEHLPVPELQLPQAAEAHQLTTG